MAAQTATEKVEKLTRDRTLVKQLKTMRQEAEMAEKRGTDLAGTFDGKKSKIVAEARTVKKKGAEMMKTYLDRGADGLDGFEFLTMAEAGEVGHWQVLDQLNKKAKHAGVGELVDVQLAIQRRHLRRRDGGERDARGEGGSERACVIRARPGLDWCSPLPTGGGECRRASELDELDDGSDLRLGTEGDPLAGERELDFLARLVDPPLDGRERHLERIGDLGVGETDDVAQEQRHLQVDAQLLDPAPDGVDRLDALERRVDHLERRDVLDVHNRARPALERAQLVEDAVLRHLEEPRREAAAEREARQPLVDAEEDLLRQILREGAVADEPKHVVVDGQLVGADDERKGAFITSLSLPQDAEIRLRQRQVVASIAAENVDLVTAGLGGPGEVNSCHFRRNLEAEQRQHGRSEVGQLAMVCEGVLV